MSTSLPKPWTQRDLDAVKKLADFFKADPQGILAIWNSESGLNPHLGPVSGYYGLIMARPEFIDGSIGTSWANLAKNGTVVDQIAAIKVFWDKTAQGMLREGVASRARKLGVRGDTVLYSLNFVPAYFAKMQSAKQPMVVSASYAQRTGTSSPDGGRYYTDNPGFDLDGKGYISVLDVQKRIDRMKVEGMRGPKSALFGAVPKSRPWWKYGLVAAAVTGGLYLVGTSSEK